MHQLHQLPPACRKTCLCSAPAFFIEAAISAEAFAIGSYSFFSVTCALDSRMAKVNKRTNKLFFIINFNLTIPPLDFSRGPQTHLFAESDWPYRQSGEPQQA